VQPLLKFQYFSFSVFQLFLPRSAHLSAVWGRNRALCLNVLIHGHLCVSCFGGCRRDAHRYTFICQKSVRNLGHGRLRIAVMDDRPADPHRTIGRGGPDQRGSISLMSIHRSNLCHVCGADQGHFSHPPRNSRRPRIPECDVEQANDRLRRMAILAVSEGGVPACRKATRTASLPPFSFPTRPNRPGRPERRMSKFSPAAENVTAGGRRTKAGRTSGMVGADVKQGSDSCSDT
jgi:hypothetical protein